MWGHLNKFVGMGYLETADSEGITQDFLDNNDIQCEVALKTYPLKAQLTPLYDPKNERIKS